MIEDEKNKMVEFGLSFRLLNSEIGNDPDLEKLVNEKYGFVFVSLTRR